MKTPFKIISHDDLVETGSRGGLDNAAAAQPSDEAKRLAIFEDDSNSCEAIPNIPDLNSTNTVMFNFNLNAMKVSTPVGKQEDHRTIDEENVKSTRKQLFTDNDRALSTILEETKSSG